MNAAPLPPRRAGGFGFCLEAAYAKQRGSLIDFDQLAAAVPRLTRRLSKASTVSSK